MQSPILAISIIFVVVILYLISVQYQKAATQRALIASRGQEIAALSAIYQTKAQKDILKQQGKATAKDWIGGFGSLVDAAGMIFTGGLSAVASGKSK